MVIQRWQSVLLLCVVVMQALFSFFSLGQLQAPDFTYNFTALGFSYEGVATNGAPTGFLINTWYFFAIALLSALLPLIAIFCFKNFRLQRRLCLMEVLVLVAVIAIGAVLGYQVIPDATIGWSNLVVAPFISIVAVVMAYNRIMADNKKLQSLNRFRD